MPMNTEKFDAIYSGLNPKQQEAVNQIEGPVLVIAGPGTGKTKVLTSRIANILLKTDAKPENILCLTYTEAGTVAMRKSLFSTIGTEAYRVNIFTFHAFCNTVIQENADFFGFRNLDAISELEQIEFVRQIISGFHNNNPLMRFVGDIFYETKSLLSLFDNMKKENWSSAYIKEKVDEYIADLPNREEYIYKRATKTSKKGDVKLNKIEDEIRKMNKLKAASDCFDLYQNKLSQNNRYDFSDMLIWVINILKKENNLLRNYQERYLYFLVDEFQDTNGSQNELLHLLVDYWDSPNVFCVGDDDQSIYRFQGANIDNILHMKQRYLPYGLNEISLEDNYRSSQNILNASNALIKQNTTRINKDKTLVARKEKYANLPIHPELREYYNLSHENVGIANEIEKLKNEGVELSEIAVLYRKHQQSEDIIKYLQSKNISINAKKKTDILNEKFIQKLLNILFYIDAETTKPKLGEVYLFEILHYDFFKLEPIEIAKLSLEIFDKNYSKEKTSWREELQKRAIKMPNELFSESEYSNPFSKVSTTIEGWMKDSLNLTVQQLLEKIVDESGILFQALTSNEKTWNMQMLHTFFDFVKDECSRKTKSNLHSICDTLKLMIETKVSLEIEKIIYAEDGVNFITVHSSKGLEFEYVFLLGCTNKNWESSSYKSDFKLPDNLFDSANDDDLEENRRLFYVAMTRAKKQLTISYAKKDLKDKDLEKSLFVAELETNAELKITYHHASDEQVLDFEINVLKSQNIQTKNNLFENELLDAVLENYSLSVTHLNSYLKCPTTFYFQNLIRIPSPKSAAATFGSAVHFALKKLFEKMKAHEQKQFGTMDDLLSDFKWFMQRNEHDFTLTEFKRKIEYAEQILPKYYSKYVNEWNKVTNVEQKYRNVLFENVPINGAIDKQEFIEKNVNVVDYKTGQYATAKDYFKRPNTEAVQKAIEQNNDVKFEDEFGGNYWRQALFYKILMDYDKLNNWQMTSCEFDFIEPDKISGNYIKEKVVIIPEDVEIVKQQISLSYAKIKNKEFSKGCGKGNCHWCNFAKDYYS